MVARHAGVRVLGLSVVTNRCLGRGEVGLEPTHQEVIDNINAVQNKVEALVLDILATVDLTDSPRPLAYEKFNTKN